MTGEKSGIEANGSQFHRPALEECFRIVSHHQLQVVRHDVPSFDVIPMPRGITAWNEGVMSSCLKVPVSRLTALEFSSGNNCSNGNGSVVALHAM
jgi:hypothetical protein